MSFFDYLDTAIGTIKICASERGITHIYFNNAKQKSVNTNHLTDLCKEQLMQYFEGTRFQFDIVLDQAGTDFQKRVWNALLKIPFGQTCSYSDIAKRIGKPKAFRAVGAANGKNLIPIIVPCHRIIGCNGTLTGYAFGLKRKEWLLSHEH